MLQQRQAQGAKKTNTRGPGTGWSLRPGGQHSALKGSAKMVGGAGDRSSGLLISRLMNETTNREHK